MVFKDFARMGVPLEIAERRANIAPFLEWGFLHAFLQWKLGQSKISMLSALERLCSRLFW